MDSFPWLLFCTYLPCICHYQLESILSCLFYALLSTGYGPRCAIDHFSCHPPLFSSLRPLYFITVRPCSFILYIHPTSTIAHWFLSALTLSQEARNPIVNWHLAILLHFLHSFFVLCFNSAVLYYISVAQSLRPRISSRVHCRNFSLSLFKLQCCNFVSYFLTHIFTQLLWFQVLGSISFGPVSFIQVLFSFLSLSLFFFLY